MDQVTTAADRDEADALRFALRLGAELPVFRPVLEQAEAFWSPDQPPATVLLGSLGSAFAKSFGTLGARDRAAVAARLEEGLTGGADYLGTAVATGFLEAAIHRAEADGTWPEVAAALGPQSRDFAEAYRNAPFHSMPDQDVPAADERAPSMGR